MIKYLICLIPFISFGQSFAPEPGVVGSTAIHKDSSIIIGWASNVIVNRGPMFIINPSIGLTTYGIDADGIGVADGQGVVSLGDGGEAVITFPTPITNGVGPDFAVFENGFIDHYMELAFVEVSSDGINFTRFDAISEIQTGVQMTNFDTTSCRRVNNFAGKYKVNYGTPFDLEELISEPGLDVNNITHIKIIDAIGILDPAYGSFDSQGTIVNDPYPTMFDSGGFDLDAVAIIHSDLLHLDEQLINVGVYPNPTTGIIYINCDNSFKLSVLNTSGQILHQGENELQVDLSALDSGIYYLEISSNDTKVVRRIIKQ